jgi:L-amino acid N-acyltransferase YncA
MIYLQSNTPSWQSFVMTMTIRPATIDDATAIQAIYAHHVLNGTGTFEIEPPDLGDIQARMEKVAARSWPWLVSLDGHGVLTGYAYAGPFRERAAYDATVEDSIYLAADAVGQGIGRALLVALIEACKVAGARQMLAVIGDSDNHASIGLHRALGFSDVGVMRGVGVKFGRALDVVILQKSL